AGSGDDRHHRTVAREGSGAMQFRAIPPNPAVELPSADLADLVFPPRADDQPMAVWAEGGVADRIRRQGPRSLAALEVPDFDLGSAAAPRAARKPPAIRADGDRVGPRLLAAEADLPGLEIEHDGLAVRPVGDRKGPTVHSQAEIGRGVECRGLEGLWGPDPEAERRCRPIEGDRPALQTRSPAGDQALAIRLEEGRDEA